MFAALTSSLPCASFVSHGRIWRKERNAPSFETMGFAKFVSWEGHIFIQNLLERPAAIKYQCTWPSLSVNDEDEMFSTSVPDSDGRDENMPDDQVPDVNVSDKGRTSAKRRRIN